MFLFHFGNFKLISLKNKLLLLTFSLTYNIYCITIRIKLDISFKAILSLKLDSKRVIIFDTFDFLRHQLLLDSIYLSYIFIQLIKLQTVFKIFGLKCVLHSFVFNLGELFFSFLIFFYLLENLILRIELLFRVIDDRHPCWINDTLLS